MSVTRKTPAASVPVPYPDKPPKTTVAKTSTNLPSVPGGKTLLLDAAMPHAQAGRKWAGNDTPQRSKFRGDSPEPHLHQANDHRLKTCAILLPLPLPQK